MGAVASVFEAIARRCPENTPDPWTMDINEQRRLAVAIRRVLGLDWIYKLQCVSAWEIVRSSKRPVNLSTPKNPKTRVKTDNNAQEV